MSQNDKDKKSRKTEIKEKENREKGTRRKEGKEKEGREKVVLPADEGLHQTAEPRDIVLNSRVRDSGGKVIFDSPILCSQLLRDYVALPYLKDVRPEDIEDVSAQFVTLFAEERNSDRVKRIHIRGSKTPFFLVSLIEHKTRPDYNVAMQIFRYMVYIWQAYEKEAEQLQADMPKRKDFLYPPILPIVYYEGSSAWDVPLGFRSRIREGEVFGKYIPDFEYYLVPLKDYSNEDLMRKPDEISLVMMINKLQTAEDIENFRRLPREKIEAILKDTPGYLLDIIADVLKAFLLKMNVSVPETENLTGKVKEKKMAELFADMEKMDIQAERQNTADAKRRAEMAEERADKEAERADRAEAHAEQEAENSIRSIIELCQEMDVPKVSAIQKLMEKKSLAYEDALAKMALYWKD